MTREHLDPTTSGTQPATRRNAPLMVVVNVLRGALIGLAELVPGVSGGTIALITGIYERIIDSAHHVISAARQLVTGPDRWRSFRTELSRAEWAMLVPLLAGMATAVLFMAGFMERFVDTQPELSRGLFLGMVGASIVVPLQMIDRSTVSRAGWGTLGAVFVAVAVAAFILTSQGSGASVKDPPMWAVFVAAAVAICALVLPGVSGSFLLYVVGLYQPTLQAVDRLDLSYIAVFAAGAIVGLALFVKALHWLLHRHHTLTMVAMAGLLLGSLRALWPWQDEAGTVLVPGSDWPMVLLLAALGAVAVAVLVHVDKRLNRSEPSSVES